jgi:two-component system, response regulator, stage 0 sporulation protein F
MLELLDPAAVVLPLRTEPSVALDTRPPAIILVDDEPDVLIIMHRLLRDLAHNHALIAVSTGHAALSNIAVCAVPLLITDYNMLGMDGLQLIETVKRISPQTHTVLITAYDSPDLRRRAHTALVDHYLAKPFSLDQLEQIVREHLT